MFDRVIPHECGQGGNERVGRGTAAEAVFMANAACGVQQAWRVANLTTCGVARVCRGRGMERET